VGVGRAVPRAPEGRLRRCGQSCPLGRHGWAKRHPRGAAFSSRRSARSPAATDAWLRHWWVPAAARRWLVAQFPAPLKPRPLTAHPRRCGQSCPLGRHGWAQRHRRGAALSSRRSARSPAATDAWLRHWWVPAAARRWLVAQFPAPLQGVTKALAFVPPGTGPALRGFPSGPAPSLAKGPALPGATPPPGGRCGAPAT